MKSSITEYDLIKDFLEFPEFLFGIWICILQSEFPMRLIPISLWYHKAVLARYNRLHKRRSPIMESFVLIKGLFKEDAKFPQLH